MHICIVGQTGSGKSVLSMQFVEGALRKEPPGPGRRPPVVLKQFETLYSTVPLDLPGVECTLVAGDREDAKRRGIPCMYDVYCGVIFVDELHRHIPARGYDKLPFDAQFWWTVHRHRDVCIVSNTQHPSFLDKIARIITDRVILCSLAQVPLLGAVMPSTVRPPDPCTCPPARRHPHPRRDALGDRATWLGRALRTGACIFWNEYPPSILNDTESLDMAFLEEQGIKKKASGFLPFDMHYARMASRTVDSVAGPEKKDCAGLKRRPSGGQRSILDDPDEYGG